ncbi:LPXTG cell wall anchor domain-containing protein [Fictibacillus sp. S7]|nr:LPXTG cell wall anchor domain-containing protein [Fictibacillus sp. S7]
MNWQVVFPMVAWIAIIALVVWFFRKRRNKK